jgi:HD superfamily phosphohydrolase
MLPLDFVDRLPDPVWRDIPVTRIEKEIIETKAFSRLRSVRQMSLAELQYPGATHTRYQHSLGAMHVGSLLAEILWDSLPKEARQPQCVQALRIALLLHDVGHPPFSHLVEHALQKHPQHLQGGTGPAGAILRNIIGNTGYSHEAFSAYVIENDEQLTRLLQAAQTTHFLPDPQQISLLARGQASWPPLSAFNSLVSGDVDADKIDYVLRDSLHCGFSVGLDINQLRGAVTFTVERGKYNLVFTNRAIPFVDSLLIARYNLSIRVHESSRNRIASQMLTENLQRALSQMKPDEKAQTIIDFHVRFSTRDFENFLDRYGGPFPLERIYRGDLLNEVLTVRVSTIHPVARLNIYKLTGLETAVRRVEERLRKVLRDPDLVVDVWGPKPPELTVAIDEHGFETALFDRHFTAHGVFVDSIMNLGVSLYSARGGLKDCDIDWDLVDRGEIQTFQGRICAYNEPVQEQTVLRVLLHREIMRVCSEICGEQRIRDRVLERDDFLLSALYGIAEHARGNLEIRECWVRGDMAFQQFIRSVEEDLLRETGYRLRRPFEWTDRRGGYSVDLFRVLERLSYMGLVDHVHKIVGHEQGFGARLDRTITGWGQMYVEEVLGAASEPVREIVQRRQTAVSEQLRQCLAEHRSIALTYDRQARARSAATVFRLVCEIRAKGGCPLEF